MNVIEKIKKHLLEYFEYDSWREFQENMKAGDCQLIAHIVEVYCSDIGAKCKAYFGEVYTDEPYIDEDGDEQNIIVHWWNKINGEEYDFAKGSMSHNEWDLDSVEFEGEKA